jgi:cobalamin biosynthetic protein CobC
MAPRDLSAGVAAVHPGVPASVPHGGDLADARALFPDAPTPWIDLSTGINPRPYPLPPVPPEAWTRLPGKAEEAALRRAAAAAYGAPGPDRVVPAPGTQALISLLPRLRPPGRVAVLSPTYGEHAAAWRAAGHEVAETVRADDLADADVAVVTRPNNPDGRLMPRADALALAAALAARGGWLVADEAFADVLDPRRSLCPDADAPGLVVLRSFGKFFGLAGVRLGFAVCAPALAADVARALGPWATSGPAVAVGTAALSDGAWIADERLRLAHEAARLDALLAAAGLPVVGGTSLFRLVEHPDARGRADRLGRAGIYVRRFPARPDRLRFGLPGHARAWRRLADALGIEETARPEEPDRPTGEHG